MTTPGRLRAALFAIALGAAAALSPQTVQAQSSNYMELTADNLESRPIYLGVDKSIVIDLPRAAGDVLVSNPAIADAVLRTSTRLYLIGVKLGQANVFLFDSAGQQITSFDVYVEADLSLLNQLLAEAIPDGYVRADAVNGSIILRGQVPSASAAAHAVEITNKMLPQEVSSITSASGNGGAASGSSTSSTETFDPSSGPGLVNLITITGEEQVALKVTIAEVEREVAKQLGINIKGFLQNGGLGLGTNVGTALGTAASGVGLSPIPFSGGGEVGIGYTGSDGTIQATLRALEETDMVRTLAEPTLTAVSGETANFLAGGEFGYQTFDDSENENGTVTRRVTVAFKPFGVELAFTPVVLSQGRISLKVRTEVSEIAGTTFGIPSLTTRRAETTVELPSGGSFVIGGLIQETTRRSATGFPGLQKIPVIGALFSSKEFLNRETELVMIVTPYLVKPTSPKELARPDENLMVAGDAESFLLNRLTKVYGRATPGPGASAGGQVGFTFD